MAFILRYSIKKSPALCHHEAGIVLLSMILILQSLAALVALLLFEYTDIYKHINRMHHNVLDYHRGKIIMTSLTSSLHDSDIHCLVQLKADDSLKQKSLQWWQETGCFGQYQAFNYAYVFEALGQDQCSAIENDNEHKMADYYRLTLNIHPEADGSGHQVLQAVVALPVAITIPCEGVRHVVTSGIQTYERL